MSMYQTPKRRRLDSARNQIGSYIYNGVKKYGAAVVGGFAARAAGGARNLGSDFAEAAGNMINSASHSATSAMRGAAERMVNGMAGGASMNIGENTICPAQLIPGRGAELSYQQLNILKAIKFKTGESVGVPLVDAYGREKMMYQGQSVMHAFAFKMQLGPASYAVLPGDSIPVNRYYVHNVFRHVLAGPNNSSQPQSPYGSRTKSWNETLGPDRSLVRQIGGVVVGGSQTGSAYAVPTVAQALNDTLESPFRYPLNGGFLYSRLTRQLMENLGWNANPMKLKTITAGVGGLGTTGLQVYSNAVQNNTTSILSVPNLVVPDADGTTGPSYTYRNQFGRGQVSYCFNNDGTNPVVIDIVITRLKKGQSILKGDVAEMVNCYSLGYLNYSYANDGQADLAGQPPAAADVTTNARGPFLPAKALDNYKRTGTGAGSATNTASAPFKQVARDQFIIAGGASRNWSTYLQSIDYKASSFAQFQNADPVIGGTIAGYDDTSNCLDEYTYIFSIACSGVPAPYVEFTGGVGAVASVIDRRGNDCSVSVTGAYKEVPHPVYLSKALKDSFINGRLDIPGFASTAINLPITTNDIANIGQATRSAANSTALIGMGPLNTVGGG